MRLDYLTIFPDYLAPLGLSLPGKAAGSGLIDVHVHDLRRWTHDRHRTVDDTPYGGGAGMVMRPEPFGEAFDELEVGAGTTVVFTTPSGQPFDQRLAEELSARDRLVFVCGRYEGVDQRVVEHARDLAEVREVSLGDYVLNGGEVAALAITEAVVRLLPGFMGNAASLVEESHADGLLEAPVYTKPAVWRGREVPAVLRSGDHGAIADWRREQAVRRTAARRPDLLHPSVLDDGTPIVRAVRADAGELFTLHRACWLQEAVANRTFDIPPLHETLAEVVAWATGCDTYVLRRAGRLVGYASGRLDGEEYWVDRLMVAPDLQGQGLGRRLLEHLEQRAPAEATSYVLLTPGRSLRNQRMYRKAGYRARSDRQAPAGAVLMTKPRRGR